MWPRSERGRQRISQRHTIRSVRADRDRLNGPRRRTGSRPQRVRSYNLLVIALSRPLRVRSYRALLPVLLAALDDYVDVLQQRDVVEGVAADGDNVA